jgi:hypothetical protein
MSGVRPHVQRSDRHPSGPHETTGTLAHGAPSDGGSRDASADGRVRRDPSVHGIQVAPPRTWRATGPYPLQLRSHADLPGAGIPPPSAVRGWQDVSTRVTPAPSSKVPCCGGTPHPTRPARTAFSLDGTGAIPAGPRATGGTSGPVDRKEVHSHRQGTPQPGGPPGQDSRGSVAGRFPGGRIPSDRIPSPLRYATGAGGGHGIPTMAAEVPRGGNPIRPELPGVASYGQGKRRWVCRPSHPPPASPRRGEGPAPDPGAGARTRGRVGGHVPSACPASDDERARRDPRGPTMTGPRTRLAQGSQVPQAHAPPVESHQQAPRSGPDRQPGGVAGGEGGRSAGGSPGPR